MADISLREYLEKIDVLLRTGKSDEVALHCRQILKYYPKHAAASRYLGQALVHSSDFRDAEPVLRRVLSIYPDDVTAHTSLSELNERLNKPNEAIWHLERALENAPNDPALVDRLRTLYQRYRNVEDPQFQLTTGAVARQYMRNGLYAQAIDTLQATLEKSPRRVDLRLLLAQTQWNAGMQIEAAETALDILDMLPDCLEANRILTLLWLAEGRPSDAQRYLNPIQEAEPYIALQLAQDAPPPDDAFTVPELDYRRIAETQIASENPDWLTQIEEPPLEESQLPENLLSEADELPAITDEDELPQDFLDLLDDADATLVSPPPVGRTGRTGLLTALDSPQDEADEAEELPVSEELPDWLMEAAPQEMVDDTPDTLEQDLDLLDWMQDAGTELDEAETEVSSFEPAATTDDAMSWALDADSEENEVPDFFGDDAFAVNDQQGTGQEDPLAWLQGSGVELLDESEWQQNNPLIDEDDEMIYQDPETIDPLAWMQRSGVELVDDDSQDAADREFTAMFETGEPSWSENVPAPDPEQEFTETVPPSAEMEEAESESLAWLLDAETEDTAAGIADSQFLQDTPATSDEADDLGWLQDESLLEDMEDVNDLEQLEGTGNLTGTSASQPETPDEQIDSADDVFPGRFFGTGQTDLLPGSQRPDEAQTEADWQSEMSENDKFEPEAQSDNDSDLSSFEWLDDESEAQPASAEAGQETPEWLTELSDDEPEWLQDEPDEVISEVETTGGPGWLTELEDDEAEESSAFDWLNEEVSEAASPEQSQTEEPAPQWLEDISLTEEPDSEIVADEEAHILAGADDEDEEEAAEAAEIPDWLAAAQPIEEVDEEQFTEAGMESAAEGAFDWMGEAEAETAAEAEMDTPDWLQDIAPTAETEGEIVADEEAYFIAGETEDEEAAEAVEMPDWLAAAQPIEEVDEEQLAEANLDAVSDAVFDWTGEEEVDTTAETPVEAEMDTPDWLQDIAPTAETEGETIADEAAYFTEDEEEAAAAVDIPDWLTAAQPIEEVDEEQFAEANLDAVSDAVFDWADEEEVDTPAETSVEAEMDTPDWLQGIAPAAETEGETIADEEAYFTEDEEEAAAAVDIPDWLAAAQPIEEIDEEQYAQADLEPAEAEEDTFDWTEEAEAETEAAADMPDWLQDIAAQPEAEPEEEAYSTESEPVSEADPMAWQNWQDEEETPAAEPDAVSPANFGQTRILPEDDFEWTDREPATEPDVLQPEMEWESEPESEAPETAGEILFDSEILDEDEEKILASAATPPPAENAPDWLNAMVPGLDLNYEATEDDRPLESTYIESPARREQPAEAREESAAASEIDWLNAIVEEETSPMRPVTEASAAQAQPRRFVFSRQPAWLRAAPQQSQTEQPEPEQPEPEQRENEDQDDDFELPDWLR